MSEENMPIKIEKGQSRYAPNIKKTNQKEVVP